jgi:hypothetical protein
MSDQGLHPFLWTWHRPRGFPRPACQPTESGGERRGRRASCTQAAQLGHLHWWGLSTPCNLHRRPAWPARGARLRGAHRRPGRGAGRGDSMIPFLFNNLARRCTSGSCTCWTRCRHMSLSHARGTLCCGPVHVAPRSSATGVIRTTTRPLVMFKPGDAARGTSYPSRAAPTQHARAARGASEPGSPVADISG